MSTWREEYQGDAEAERLLFDRLALDMMQVQLKTKKSSKAAGIKRAFHSKGVFAAVDGTLRFVDDLPGDLSAGFAAPGKSYPTIVRLSNASGSAQPDYKPDLRGIALRIKVSDERAARSAGDQFPGFARARRHAVRGFRQSHGRRNAEPARRHHRPGLQVRAVRGGSHAAQHHRRAQAARSPAWRWKPSGAAAPSAGATPGACAICCGRPPTRRIRAKALGDRSGLSVERVCAAARRRRHPLRALHAALRRRADRRRSRILRSSGRRRPRRRSWSQIWLIAKPTSGSPRPSANAARSSTSSPSILGTRPTSSARSAT